MVAVQVGARQSVINARWLERKVDFSAMLAAAAFPLPSARAHSLQLPRLDIWRELRQKHTSSGPLQYSIFLWLGGVSGTNMLTYVHIDRCNIGQLISA